MARTFPPLLRLTQSLSLISFILYGKGHAFAQENQAPATEPQLPSKQASTAPTSSEQGQDAQIVSLPGSTEDEELPVELQRDAGLEGRSRKTNGVDVEEILH